MKLTKIIALYGAANTGKTTTLNYLIDLLKKAQSLSDYSTISIEDCGDKRHADQRVVVEIQGLKIAITTSGDNGTELKRNIEYFKQNDCDIAITATRTRGYSVEELKGFSNVAGLNVERIRKEYNHSDEMDQSNRAQSLNLFHIILKDLH
jgi:Cdc6-like AAA superfamily ATPase